MINKQNGRRLSLKKWFCDTTILTTIAITRLFPYIISFSCSSKSFCIQWIFQLCCSSVMVCDSRWSALCDISCFVIIPSVYRNVERETNDALLEASHLHTFGNNKEL